MWMEDGPLSLDNVPPLPALVTKTSEYWLNCRNCELRNATEHGDAGTVARGTLRQFGRTIRSNVGQSFARCSDEHPVHHDGGLDQRGRHQEEVRPRRSARWSVTGNLRYGLRGCRIGEASNPGPCRIRPEGVPEAVVESLEQALTAVDTSDEEPLVRSVTGRHVFRRVGEPEQSSEICITRLDSFDEVSMSTTLPRASHLFLSVGWIRVWLVFRGVIISQFRWNPRRCDVHSACPVSPHLGRSGG